MHCGVAAYDERKFDCNQSAPRRALRAKPATPIISVVIRAFSLRLRWTRRRLSSLALTVLCAAIPALYGQGQTAAQAAASGDAKVLLVLPFDSRAGQPSLDWIREAAVEVLSKRFASAGFQPTSRADRTYALDHLGLPQGFQPSRASALKLAQTLDADSIVVGSFSLDGNNLVATARLVDVPQLRMTPEVSARGPMRDLIAVFSSLAWKLTRQIDPNFSVAEETFTAAGKGIRLDAYEQYIRGITEPDQAERLAHLQKAVKLNPEFGPAWMALGRELYASQQYQEAASAFAKVDRNGTDGLEAGFYRGMSLIFSGDYAHAEQAFAEVAKVLPLAEVENNQGVAASRQGHDGMHLFMQAAAADPNAADYHFNLAVSLKRHGDLSGALNEIAQCLKQRPGDSEAQLLEDYWKHPSSASGVDPLERIVRNFDAAAFKQAAAMIDQVDAGRLAALAPPEHAQALCTQAKSYLNRGLLLEAERLFQEAAATDNKSAAAHAGLAELRRRSGDLDAARKQARASLDLKPTADAYLVLARLDLASGSLGVAGDEIGAALKLEPNNVDALDLQRQIMAKSRQK